MSNATLVKKENIRKIIQTIRNSDYVTMPEVASMTGLTVATVHNVITSLEAKSLLKKHGLSASNGGRKAQQYAINEEHCRIAGIALRTDKIKVGIFNFKMDLIIDQNFEWKLADHTVEETIHHMQLCLESIISRSGVNRDEIAAIGINAPGPVDFFSGRIIALRGYPKWRKIDLANQIHKLTGIPTFVDKDVNSGLLLVKQIKKCRDDCNILFISVEEGIGAGIMIGGEIFRGNNGIAGEIGHTIVQENGELCECGNVGCLELVSSDLAIIRQSKKVLGIPENEPFTVNDAIKLYNSDPQIKDILIKATRYLAMTIRNCSMLYDPDEIFIRCSWLEFNKALLFQLIDDFYNNNTLINRGNIHVSLIEQNKFVLRSAAAIAWNYKLSFPENSNHNDIDE